MTDTGLANRPRVLRFEAPREWRSRQIGGISKPAATIFSPFWLWDELIENRPLGVRQVAWLGRHVLK